ncbi:hypothetical protein GWI33_013700 [Rhynchophorus ferrugineus]|uniref:Actin-related protein 6 n=1 Tax=Rhynchophorus ferrugineus TaxID=354439 RepID=A0A834I6J9_RHYFE|nr:hypothetical protein GWI33_013700 [Rhynchophorus ferrugineus]
MYKRRRSSAGKEQFIKAQKTSNLKALIVDNGAYTIKAGYNKDEEPHVIPNCIMKAKSERKRLFIGKQIDECRDCSGLYFLLPCERGYITRWEVQKPVWDHLFSKDVCPVDDHPTVITQPMFNFKSIQDCLDEIFFEEYEVPSLFRCNPTDMAYLNYAQERRLTRNDACLLIDTGFSFTHIIPYIKDSTMLWRKHIKTELKEASKPLKKNSIVRNYVLPDFNNIRRGYIQEPDKTDQKEVEESCQILRLNNERFVVPEILFHPSDIGMKSMGIAEAAVKSIFCCPEKERRSLAKNIVVVGGNCKFPGFKERLYTELRSLLPDQWEMNVYQPDNPITYAWKGGGALLKTHDFKSNLVTKQDYEELGSTIIQERFNNFMLDDSRLEKTSNVPAAETSFRYLEKLKSRTIFGKQESTSSTDPIKDSESSPQKADHQGESVSTTATEKDESNPPSDEQSQDGLQADEVEKRRRGRGAKKQTEDLLETQSDDEESEEDLTKSVELFPLGTSSYL